MRSLDLLVAFICLAEAKGVPAEQRRKVVQSFSVRRNASSDTTPLQVGNGNFAFGADITGLQTFKPFAIMNTWGWHNFSLPTTPGQTSVEDYTGLEWWTHGRLVSYEQPNPAQNDISNWLRENPHRLNLANVGLHFGGANVVESDLKEKIQELDMWSGRLTSSSKYNGSKIEVQTWADSDSDTIAVQLQSALLKKGSLGLFLDFPYPDKEKFNAPFVGHFNLTSKHKTTLERLSPRSAQIKHTLDDTSYYTRIQWEGSEATITGPLNGTHRYILTPKASSKIQLVISFAPTANFPKNKTTYQQITTASRTWWHKYWTKGAFIDLTPVKSDPRALELQRRIIQSQYLTAVNSASDYPPQESGLVNNGWHGKFHLEMNLWHTLPFARWNHFDLFHRSLPHLYTQLLPSSISRAKKQGYKGARWGKMTDPITGRSSPGEINSLLIWQQPHPMFFAETDYLSHPDLPTLQKWDDILTETANFMASFAWYNSTTKFYDLGPPMYPVSENTNPNITLNPTFELAYWRFGLDIAIKWKSRLNQSHPAIWSTVLDNLAPFPIVNNTYATYEGIPNMWLSEETTFDHPAQAGIFGLLPPSSQLNLTIVQNTADKIKETWHLEQSYGWDFAMLAMNSLRLGDVDQAVEYLLHPIFKFDDAGYAVGGERVPTPYFPNSAGLLVAVGMMASGWRGEEGVKLPGEWVREGARVEGFVTAL
ncbi:Six-hairpin glycosidase-like protein [Apiosordaria backusii]|uniref:Six-hairpin glycosidase-like protein n=1 Tax=Apiosordaria backusii TaxID=314023 RepID=A0AA40EY01_9PEZI|nr:Six-hairpin glycosidase-like protein [Apiosordaria backusii]